MGLSISPYNIDRFDVMALAQDIKKIQDDWKLLEAYEHYMQHVNWALLLLTDKLEVSKYWKKLEALQELAAQLESTAYRYRSEWREKLYKYPAFLHPFLKPLVKPFNLVEEFKRIIMKHIEKVVGDEQCT